MAKPSRFLSIFPPLLWMLAPVISLGRDAPLVLDQAVVIQPPATGDAKSDIRYYGQPAKDGRIDLTPTNGFFDDCFKADQQQPVIPGDERFINCSFGALVPRGPGHGSARWHLWCPQVGEIHARFFVSLAPAEINHSLTITAGGESHPLTLNAGDGESALNQSLRFDIKSPGEITFAIDCTKDSPPPSLKLFRITLQGSAIAPASLLRVRWRPSAVHQHFAPPTTCPAPHMWVFETRSTTATSSYSPITTPFGYFGTTFDDRGQVAKGSGFNFSMWIAGRNATTAPPINRLPCLIGTGLPGAQFSSFGGEGTGIKFRDAIAYPNGADKIIQAMRVETHDGRCTYYGYFYDESQHHWVLFASAGEPVKRASITDVTLGAPGSFCEIPGPPAVQRSGDVVREIKRRGWFRGNDNKWYPALLPDGKRATLDPDVPDDTETPGQFDSKRVYYMNDFHTRGWIAMATGGIANYAAKDRSEAAPAVDHRDVPEYLSPEKTAELYQLPVEFGPSTVSNLTTTGATIDYPITKTGSHSTAICYYGTVDCLTYAPREIKGGSAVEQQLFSPERTWQFATAPQTVAAGDNHISLTNLKSKTTYYYRLFVAHDQGKSWAYQTGTFQTP